MLQTDKTEREMTNMSNSNLKLYRIRSHYNCNSLAIIQAVDEQSALTQFNSEMAPVVLDVYAQEKKEK